MGKLVDGILKSLEVVDTPNLEEMVNYEMMVSGSASVSIRLDDAAWYAYLIAGKRQILKSTGNNISQALKNLELAAVEFLGDEAV